ncbi:translocating chain-associated membrane protein 1-like [Plakobranchus ocellatus]|uniref:Translocating chain-associated membrane protein n=1 Tax=Plakobranchus ocellatus TaxID=259542 RepID=A0AAV4ABM4_9GAST|nr:translocating chain-associated membrane protein 1-like [Plakobranchus ocellatus]
MAPRRSKNTKSPQIFSHEFFIQNHADIVSCIAMVFVIGLIFQATTPIASLFITLQHNQTINDSVTGDSTIVYGTGSRDLFTVCFYCLVCIVVHAVIQEYLLDKLNRKMHLSKVKHSKFNESGQLLVFFLASALWGADLFFRENYITSVNQLWEGYPHNQLPFIVKFFFIIQISYWLHNFPELYFQKVRKEEIPSRVQYTALYLSLIAAAYFLNFNRVALCLLVLHYTAEFLYHTALLCHYSEKTDLAASIFMVFDVLFVLVRLGSFTLAVLTFWIGLAQSNQASIDLVTGNYNTNFVRMVSLAAVCLSQAGLMWNFITFQLRKFREKSASSSSRKPRSPTKKKQPPAKPIAAEELDSLPEVDQNSATENGNVRARKAKK